MELLSVVDSQSLRKIAVTNAPPKNVELMLKAIGLSDYFEEVVFGAHCARPKPFPDPYLLGLENIGMTPDCTLVFEDSPAGTFSRPTKLLPAQVSCVSCDPVHKQGTSSAFISAQLAMGLLYHCFLLT